MDSVIVSERQRDLRALGVTAATFAAVVKPTQSGTTVQITIGANMITLSKQKLADITIAHFIGG